MSSSDEFKAKILLKLAVQKITSSKIFGLKYNEVHVILTQSYVDKFISEDF